MPKHYDVVVLGRSLGALTAAALLARRDFTVLVLGQGATAPTYGFRDRLLRRRAFTFSAGMTPVWKRVLAALAQSQAWKRRVEYANPMIQLLDGRCRFDVPADSALFQSELAREFSNDKAPIAAFYAALAEMNLLSDEAFGADAVWPPGTYWERRETSRHARKLPSLGDPTEYVLPLDVPTSHPFRQFVDESAAHVSNLAGNLNDFSVARLHGSWTRGLASLPGGEQELEDFLVERIQAHGGVCLLDERGHGIEVRRGDVTAVVMDGNEQLVGSSFLVSDLDGENVAALAGGQGLTERAQRDWPVVRRPISRFAVSLVVRNAGVPEPLGTEQILFGRPSPGAMPVGGGVVRGVHLQNTPMNEVERLLVAEVLLDEGALEHVRTLREVIVQWLLREFPYMEEHVVAVDSVYDGLPLWEFAGGKRKLLDRRELRGASSTAEQMPTQVMVLPHGFLGLAGEPVRGPIGKTFLVGPTVLPSLGQEGQLLAAWSAARIITQNDKQKTRMRRNQWNRAEIG